MAQKTIEETTRTTDTSTGETKEIVKSIIVKTGSQEEFFMMFVKALSSVYKLKSITDFRVLAKLCQLATYNSGLVSIPPVTRKIICEELGISTNNLTNSLNSLKKLGIITGGGGVFELNPVIAWKGDLRTREKVLKKMRVDFRIEFNSDNFES